MHAERLAPTPAVGMKSPKNTETCPHERGHASVIWYLKEHEVKTRLAISRLEKPRFYREKRQCEWIGFFDPREIPRETARQSRE